MARKAQKSRPETPEEDQEYGEEETRQLKTGQRPVKKGEIRWTEDGILQYYDPKAEKWRAAAYHHDHREEFIDEDAPQAGTIWAPARGFAEHDETSYKVEQKWWSVDHLDRIVDEHGAQVFAEGYRRMNRKPDPGFWYHDDKVLLDYNDRPIRGWPELNKTISTEIEGWRWEAIRRCYPWITVVDIAARMPHFRLTSEDGETLPVQVKTTFTNRAHNFRCSNALKAMFKRSGSDVINKGFDKVLKNHKSKKAGFVPKLTPNEIEQVKEGNQGKFKSHSRYVVEEEDGSRSGQMKRKAMAGTSTSLNTHRDQGAPKKLKRENQASPSPVGNLDPRSPYSPYPAPHDYWARQGPYTQVTNAEGSTYEPFSAADDIIMIPLFTSLKSQVLARAQGYETPRAALKAIREGSTRLNGFAVLWYDRQTERELGNPNVVMEEERHAGFQMGLRNDRSFVVVSGEIHEDHLPQRNKCAIPLHPYLKIVDRDGQPQHPQHLGAQCFHAPSTAPSAAPPNAPLLAPPTAPPTAPSTAPPTAASTATSTEPLPPPPTVYVEASAPVQPVPQLPQRALVPNPDDEEAQHFEYPWRHDYRGFGF